MQSSPTFSCCTTHFTSVSTIPLFPFTFKSTCTRRIFISSSVRSGVISLLAYPRYPLPQPNRREDDPCVSQLWGTPNLLSRGRILLNSGCLRQSGLCATFLFRKLSFLLTSAILSLFVRPRRSSITFDCRMETFVREYISTGTV